MAITEYVYASFSGHSITKVSKRETYNLGAIVSEENSQSLV